MTTTIYLDTSTGAELAIELRAAHADWRGRQDYERGAVVLNDETGRELAHPATLAYVDDLLEQRSSEVWEQIVDAQECAEREGVEW